MPSDHARRFADHLELHREGLFRLLERLVEAESPSDDPTAQEAMFAILTTELAAIDYVVTRVSGGATGGQLLARPARRVRGRPYQVLVGHCDTVWPHGTLARMPIVVDRGRMHGPGVYDMKGGLAQMIYSLKALRELGIEPDVTPVVLVNSDEETGSLESQPLVARLSRWADRVLVLEPALPGGEVKTARKGVGRYKIEISGRAAHAGLEPSKGVSAIVELAHVVQQLDALNSPEEGVTVNVGTIDGGLRPNVVAPTGRAEADVRIVHREQADHLDRAIREIRPRHPDARITVTGGITSWPLERTPRNRRLWEAARHAAAGLGIDLVEAMVGGGSDGNTASLYTATLDGLGPIGDGAHADHEHIVLDSLVERGALLALLLCEPALGDRYLARLAAERAGREREPVPTG